MASEQSGPEPRRWLTHYPRVLKEYWLNGEDGLEIVEERLRTEAARRPGGKFSKAEAGYVPFVPLPPVDWRHECGHCRFWVDQGPGEAGECMIVGREDDGWGGKSIHERAGCALFTPPAGEQAFDWIAEQFRPTGADLVRGEYHPSDGAGERASGEPDARSAGISVGTSLIPPGTTVDLEPVVEGLTAPVAMAFDPDDPGRSFVADQAGLVYLHREGSRGVETVLDLREKMVELTNRYDERGLLGLALHPEFTDNGRLFVRYSAPNRDGTPDDYDHTEVLAEFELDDGESEIDPDSERAIMEIPHPRFNHNAGSIAFGPDGYLYVPMGDGGGEGDTGFGHVEGGNGQDVTENRLGCVMRIDVDDGNGQGAYGIPDDNPLVDEEGIDELYAWGLRNPWGLSFDGDGRLFVADVGQALFEEINLVEKGGNYGWPIREGFHCFDPENPNEPPANCPDESARGEPLRDPIVEYPHVDGDDVVGSAVVGGAVYEEESIPGLSGKYVFGDWATTQDRPSGRLFAASPPDVGGSGGARDGEWETEELVVGSTQNGRPNRNVLGISSGPDGEVYLLSSRSHAPRGETGAIHRLVPPS